MAGYESPNPPLLTRDRPTTTQTTSVDMSLLESILGKRKGTPPSDSEIEFLTEPRNAQKRAKVTQSESDQQQLGQMLTVQSLVDQTPSIEDEESFPKDNDLFLLAGQDSQDLIAMPEFSQGECPIRNLKITNQMLSQLEKTRKLMVENFRELNEDF